MFNICQNFRGLIYGFSIHQGMEGQGQQLVTLRIGTFWFDVPIGLLVILLSQCLLRSTDPSSTKQDQEKEVNLHRWKCSPLRPCPFKVSHAEYKVG
jgi:hypothetical protein